MASASIAGSRVKLLRQASTTRRSGTGSANGTYDSMSPLAFRSGTEVRGSTVMPTPLATIWRMVSSDEPSNVFWMPSAACEKRDSSGHTPSTWSRKQWPLPSSSMVCRFSSSGSIACASASWWPRGTATTKGSS
ncbi:hypothetical protein D3C72_1537970 [compost metagenome]